MKRKANEGEVARLFHHYGWDWHKFEDKRICPICHQLQYKAQYLPFDGVAIVAGQQIPIEIKQVNGTSFAFAEIRDNQRSGLQVWSERHRSPAWLFLTVGEERVNANAETRRRSWLIPCKEWFALEGQARLDGLESLPMCRSASRGAYADLSLAEVFPDHELPWRDSGWQVPEFHPFGRTYPALFLNADVNIYSLHVTDFHTAHA